MLELLHADECRRLLATRQIGRIGLAGGRFPLILPVNYGLDGDAVVIRTDSAAIGVPRCRHDRSVFHAAGMITEVSLPLLYLIAVRFLSWLMLGNCQRADDRTSEDHEHTRI